MAARIITSQICNGGAFPSKIPHPPVAHFPHLPATHFPHLPAASRPNFLKLAASRPNFPKLDVSHGNFPQLSVQLAVSRGIFTPRSKVNTDSDLMTNLETAPDPANLDPTKDSTPLLTPDPTNDLDNAPEPTKDSTPLLTPDPMKVNNLDPTMDMNPLLSLKMTRQVDPNDSTKTVENLTVYANAKIEGRFQRLLNEIMLIWFLDWLLQFIIAMMVISLLSYLGGSPRVVPERIFKFLLTMVLHKVWKYLHAAPGEALQGLWRWCKGRIWKL